MKFEPPLINNIEDVLPHIKDNPAFIVVDKGWYKVIDYVYAHRDTFNNAYASECRGLKFCSKTGDILARPYHKFHNLNERAGYHSADIDLTEPHNILDKLDGSMIHTCLNPETGNIVLMTRMGHTDVAKLAEAFVDKVTGPGCEYGLGHQLADLIFDNTTKTFIFEYVGPYNRIVVPYETEELILTGIRDIRTGVYETYMGMQAYLARFDKIPLVQHYGSAGGAPVDDFYNFAVRSDEVNEGCVVRFDTGAMVKMKSEIYCLKHKSKELTESNKGVVQVIIDGNLDDILPQLEDKIADALEDYAVALQERLMTLVEGIRHNLSLRKAMDQKTFALNVQANFPKPMQGLLFMTRKSGDGYAELINLIKKRYNKEQDLNELFDELEIPKWKD